MDDPIDRAAWKLDEQIQGVLTKIKGQTRYAGLEGKLLALSARLTGHHLRYGMAIQGGKQAVASREANAIGACEREFKQLMLPPGALDIRVSYD